MSAAIKSAIRCPTEANALNNCLTQRRYPEECRFTRFGGGATMRTPSIAAEAAVRTGDGIAPLTRVLADVRVHAPGLPSVRSRIP